MFRVTRKHKIENQQLEIPFDDMSSSSSDEEWERPESAPSPDDNPKKSPGRDSYLFAAETAERREKQRLEHEQQQRDLEEKRRRERERDRVRAPAQAPTPKVPRSFPSPPPVTIRNKTVRLSDRPPAMMVPEVHDATSAATTLWRAIFSL